MPCSSTSNPACTNANSVWLVVCESGKSCSSNALYEVMVNKTTFYSLWCTFWRPDNVRVQRRFNLPRLSNYHAIFMWNGGQLNNTGFIFGNGFNSAVFRYEFEFRLHSCRTESEIRFQGWQGMFRFTSWNGNYTPPVNHWSLMRWDLMPSVMANYSHSHF